GAVEFASSAFLLPGLESRLFLLRTNDTIDEVDIALTRDSVVVAGDVIRRLGAPCYTAPIGTTLVAKYQHLAVFFSMEQAGPAWVLKPTSRVIEIRLLGGEARSCLEINNKTIFAWRGFTRYGD
ncbi:MAG TPA: hypothetical protein VMT34_11520, partial [Aggregatilineales bacterium]|nr:hypothetical protein [Aggregatilineales bacterium]